MKIYNKSLDYTLLALASAANGDHKNAGALLLKAAKSPDVKRAVAVLEASNAQAFDAEQARVQAAAKAKKETKPEVKAGKVGAAQRVAAKTPAKAATQVKAFDMGDEAEINELIDSGDIDDDVDEAEVVEEAAVEEDEGDDDFNTAFASVLKGLEGKKR